MAASEERKVDLMPTATTGAAAALGTGAMTANGTIQSHRRYTTYYFEYGWRTKPAPLPSRLAAYYRESWDDEGPGGWAALYNCKREHFSSSSAGGGYLRFSEQPLINDFNHEATGNLHLMAEVDTGPLGTRLHLGGGDADLRGGRISLYLRGRNWQPNGSEYLFWLQSQSNIELLDEPGWQRANFAYTGFRLTDYLLDGQWHRVEFELANDASQWTYGGNNRVQQGSKAVRYQYWSIDSALAHANCNIIFLSAFVNPENPPTGSVDFDELEIRYRNRSLVFPANGGRLIAWPQDSDEDPANLTDGWRHGEGHMWRSAADPPAPIEFTYQFETEVVVETVQLHQHTEWPSMEAEVLASMDGNTYQPLVRTTIPETATDGPNFTFAIERGLHAPARFLQVRLISGYRSSHWGLGEIELFGSGARMQSDENVCAVNTDIGGLEPGQTCHYRLVAEENGVNRGEDRTFNLPEPTGPVAETGVAFRVEATRAKVEGRLNPLGVPTFYYFEYGKDIDYRDGPFAHATVATVFRRHPSQAPAVQLPVPGTYAGMQITPRSVFAEFENLHTDTTYHYRLVGVNQNGVTYGGDATFTTARV